MVLYVFDETFEGFLTCVYQYYYSDKKADKIIGASQLDSEYNLLDEFINIETCSSKSDKVYNALEEKLSPNSFSNIYYCFLSELPNIYTTLLKFIVLGFKLGRELDLHMHNPIVMEVIKTKRKVSLEAHRFLGFVRFTKLQENYYYSSIEPDFNILPLIYNHFIQRFKSMNFVIHDLKRHVGIFYIDGEFSIGAVDDSIDILGLNNSINDNYSKLWTTYLKSATIKNRENKRLQNRMMPQRYWKHLIELQNKME